MKIQIMDRAKKKKFIAELAGLGMKKIPQMLVKSGKERVRAFSGSLGKDDIYDIWRLLPIEGIGLYVGKDMMNRSGVREVRLSLDGMHVWKEQLEAELPGVSGCRGVGVSGRVVFLSEEQEELWFKGENIELNEEQVGKISDGFVCVKGGDDFVGMGKIGDGGKTLFGYLPKERRRKSQTI